VASYDLRKILDGWPFEAGQITVRKISGDDGKPKVQMRLDLGLLQMELDGRPDGKRPHDCDSLLQYHQRRLEEHRARNGTDLGFELSGDDAQSLREEAVMYYHRYLSLFVLEDFARVERDTSRNLAVLDLCRQYASNEEDRASLEPYRVYLIMMNTRGKAHQAIRRRAFKTALALVDAGLNEIRRCFDGEDIFSEDFEDAREVGILVALRGEIAERLPSDPVRELEMKLTRAIREERYEEAARLRDEIEVVRRRAIASEDGDSA